MQHVKPSKTFFHAKKACLRLLESHQNMLFDASQLLYVNFFPHHLKPQIQETICNEKAVTCHIYVANSYFWQSEGKVSSSFNDKSIQVKLDTCARPAKFHASLNIESTCPEFGSHAASPWFKALRYCTSQRNTDTRVLSDASQSTFKSSWQ